MATLSICLFGKFCVRCNERVLFGFEGHKLQELLSYLLLHRDHSHPREILAGLLWAESSTAQSKRNLRQLLWQIQTALDSQVEALKIPLLCVEPECVNLNSHEDLWLDVAAFEQAFSPVQNIQGQDLDAPRVTALQDAVELYQGDLLEGWYEDWCVYERERFQNIYLTILDKLMGYCKVNREYESGISYGSRILSHDRAREHTHRQLMRLQYLSGNRTGALRQYERCANALEEELDVRPAKSTVALYEQIRADELDIQARSSEVTRSDRETTNSGLTPTDGPSGPLSHNPIRSPEIDTPRLPEVLSRLKEVQQALADVQELVQQDIQNGEIVRKVRANIAR